MIITCSSCDSKYRYDETKLEGAASKRVKCPKCKKVIEVLNPLLAGDPSVLEHTFSPNSSGERPRQTVHHTSNDDSPTPLQVRRDAVVKDLVAHGMPVQNIKMPLNRRYSLAVISGQNAGEIFHLTKPYVILGRAEGDILVRDAEASRQHARLEVMGDRVVIRDLNSTNGTFVNEEKVTAINLENQSEFRIGTTLFMLIITDVE